MSFKAQGRDEENSTRVVCQASQKGQRRTPTRAVLCTSLGASYPTGGSEQAEDRALQEDSSSQKREVMMATIVTNFTAHLPGAQALFLVPHLYQLT